MNSNLYGSVPTFNGSLKQKAFSEKFFARISKKILDYKELSNEFDKEKGQIERTYAKINAMTQEEASEYYDKTSDMLHEERKRTFSLNIPIEEKKIREKEIAEYQKHVKFMIFDYRFLSKAKKERYVNKRIEETRQEYDEKKQEIIIEIKKEIEMYVKFLNRILIKYNDNKSVYEEYRKISNHKFNDDEMQKIYDNKVYETLMELPQLHKIVTSYSEYEEFLGQESKKEELKNTKKEVKEEKEEPLSVTSNSKQAPESTYTQVEPKTDSERIKLIRELIEKSAKENNKDYLIDAYGYKLALPDSEEKKKIEQAIYKMIDIFKIKEVEDILKSNPSDEELKRARKLINELSYGPQKSMLIDYINKMTSPISNDYNSNIRLDNGQSEPQFNVHSLGENGLDHEFDEEKIRQQVEENVRNMRQAG